MILKIKVKIVILLVLISIALAAVPSGASSTCSIDENFYYSIDDDNNYLHIIDSSDGHIISTRTLSLPDGSYPVGNGLTNKPGTCELFAILSIDGNSIQQLAKINPVSGAVTFIGDLNDDFAGLAFDSAGTLYGVTDFDANEPSTLFSIDTNIATATEFLVLTSNDGSEAIAFKNGLIYHASGSYDNLVFESIDLSTKIITQIDLTGDELENLYNIQALANFKDDKFLLGDSNQYLYSITTDGQVVYLGDTGHYSKGLAPPCTDNSFLADQDLYYSIDAFQNQLYVIDSSDGHTVSSTPITLPDDDVYEGNGLAHKPGTCELFAILRISDDPSYRHLATINPITGVAALKGSLNDKFAGLAFDPAGTLYGVTGYGANQPSTLFTIDTNDASETLFLPLTTNFEGGESIAFKENLIYHASGRFASDQPDNGLVFEAIDPLTNDITQIPLSGDYESLSSIQTLANFKENKLLLVDQNQELYSITTDGFVEDIGWMDHYSKGLVAPVPELSTFALSTIGILGLVLLTRKRVI